MNLITRVHNVFDDDGLVETLAVSTNWNEVRSVRNEELEKSDWRFMSDNSPSDEWTNYRVFLRELPQNYEDSDEAADALNDYEKPEDWN